MGSLYGKAILCAVLGAVGGALAFFLARPYLGDVAAQSIHPNYTLGSVFGWLAHGLLGAFIVSSIATVIGYDDSGIRGAVISGGVGLVLGAFAGYGSDALYDWLMIKSNMRTLGFGTMLHGLWSLFVCSAMSLAIFVSTGARLQRLTRCLAAAGISTLVGTFARQTVGSMMATRTVMGALQNPSSFMKGDKWIQSGPEMLAEFCVIGIVLGAIFGIVEAMMKPVRLRQVLGVNEWRTWALTADSYRIGSAEASEIRVADSNLAPLHAYVVKQGKQFCIQEAGSGLVVNGIATPAHWLSEGDVIQLGNATFFFGEGQLPTPGKVARPLQSAALTPVNDPRLVDSFGNVYNLSVGTHIVGRDPTANIALTWDEKVSRRHAEIRVDVAGTVISDLGSRNGTSVEGAQIQGPTQILPGTRIQVGSTLLTYLA
jgi:pSer/pThr/pTyr-binding forkhead associated (FHA) protein